MNIEKELEHAEAAVASLPRWKRVTLERTKKAEESLGYVPPPSAEAKLVNKPHFKEGDRVRYQLEGISGTGTIRGRAIVHIIDFWIVESDVPLPPEIYEWSCFTIQHTHLEKI